MSYANKSRPAAPNVDADKKSASDPLALKASRSLRYAIVLVISLIFVYVVWFGLWNHQPLSEDAGKWGAFGDFIGGLMNPIVALLALYWLTQSIAVQKQELKDTRTVLEAQAEANEVKRFEDTFFALLAEHNSLLSKASPDVRAILNKIFYKTDDLDAANETLKSHDDDVGHYFRVLYQVMKFIAIKCPGTTCTLPQLETDSPQGAPSEQEKFYSNILRSALDTKTSQLLAINCFCTDSKNSYFKYRRLVERYAFLEHMPFIGIGHNYSNILRSVYEKFEKGAFGNSDYVKELDLLGLLPDKL